MSEHHPAESPRRNGFRRLRVDGHGRVSITSTAPAGGDRVLWLEGQALTEFVLDLLGRLGPVTVEQADAAIRLLRLSTVIGGGFVGGRVLPAGGGSCPSCGWSCGSWVLESETVRGFSTSVEMSARDLRGVDVETVLDPMVSHVDSGSGWLRCGQCDHEWMFDWSVPVIEPEAEMDGRPVLVEPENRSEG